MSPAVSRHQVIPTQWRGSELNILLLDIDPLGVGAPLQDVLVIEATDLGVNRGGVPSEPKKCQTDSNAIPHGSLPPHLETYLLLL